MDLENQVPIFIFHLLKGDISQNTSIVKKDVHLAEVIDSSFNNLVSELD